MLGHRSNLEGIILARKKIAKTLFCGKQLSFVKRTIFVNSFSSSISLSRLNYPLLLILHYLPSPLSPSPFSQPLIIIHPSFFTNPYIKSSFPFFTIPCFIGGAWRWPESEFGSKKFFLMLLALLPWSPYLCLLSLLFLSISCICLCGCNLMADDAPSWFFQVQEIVLTADIRCAECQKKLANILSKMNGEFVLYFLGNFVPSFNFASVHV